MKKCKGTRDQKKGWEQEKTKEKKDHKNRTEAREREREKRREEKRREEKRREEHEDTGKHDVTRAWSKADGIVKSRC